MTTVGIRELKNKLSAYIRLVRRGERVLVTDRGQVVAELRPPEVESDHVSPGLRDLERRGLVRIGKPNRPGIYRRFGRIAPDGTAARLIDEDRGER